ncbi:glutamine amidotransferase-related protein [Desulfobacterota bacterium M19]
MAKHLIILQRTLYKRPGRIIIETAKRFNIKVNIVKLWRQSIPSLAKYDGLVVLDGSLPCLDDKSYSSFQKQKEIIHNALNEDRPYLGIGLGHHLLALNQGADIGTNYCCSIGFTTAYLTHKGREHPIFKDIPCSLSVFKWHNRAIMPPIPSNIDVLATSVDCQFEAVSVPSRPYITGLQFINNVASPREVKRYLAKDQEWLSSAASHGINQAFIMAEAKRLHSETSRYFTILFSNFINML